MSKDFVLLGDKTTHGGAVISASSTMIVNGKPVALVGISQLPIPDMALMPLLRDRRNGLPMVKPSWSMAANVSAVAR